MVSIRTAIFILLLNFDLNILVPSFNPLAVGQSRTEIIEDIWQWLDDRIRGAYIPPVQPNPLNPIEDDRPIHVLLDLGNTECGLRPLFHGMNAVMWQNVPNNGHQIHFRKDSLLGNRGRDPTDNSPLYVIFASRTNDWLLFLCMRDDDVQQHQLRYQ